MSTVETNSGVTLTAKEVATLVSAFSTSEVSLKPNYEAMAEQVGYSNARSASTMWGNLRRKLLGNPNQRSGVTLKRVGNSNNSPKKATAPKLAGGKPSPSKKKAAKTTSRYLSPEDDDDEDGAQLDEKVEIKEEEGQGAEWGDGAKGGNELGNEVEKELGVSPDDYIIWDN